MSTWYYAGAERQPLGPLSTDELKQYFHSERLALDTMVWRDGMIQWRPLGELAQQLGLVSAPAPALTLADTAPPLSPPPVTVPAAEEPAVPAAEAAVASAVPAAATPGASGRAVFNLGSDPSPTPAPVARIEHAEPDAAAAARNPYLAGRAPLRGRASSAPDPDVVYAGFWKRAAAAIVDGVILSVVVGLCGEALGTILGDLSGGGEVASVLLNLACTLALNACYFAWFHSTFNYATPGKMLIGIKVVRNNGDPISFLRGLARFFASILSSLILCIGYLLAAFTPRKQSLHDFICGTVVVDKWAYTSHPEQQRTELGTAAVVVLGLYALLLAIVAIAFVALGFSAARYLT